MKYVYLSVLFLFLCSCVNESGKQAKTTETPIAKRKINDSALAQKLYQNYHDNPVTQAQKDENALIDYALDKNLDVKRTESGLYYIIHREGTGPLIIKNQPIKADYQGYLLNGKVFDSSYNRGKPIAFNVGQMIPGWNEALLFMNSGTKAQLLIPSHLAYGAKGFPGLIEPHSPLIFDLEVLPL